MNTQPPEKRPRADSGGVLEIVSIFFTLQGEGPFTGRRAIFIRLAGCNLQCPLCDTDYTTGRQLLPIKDIIDKVNINFVKGANGAPEETGALVVITGGEPFRQDIAPLVDCLIHLNYRVQIETNGTFPPPEGLNQRCIIVCSPKTGKVNPKTESRADCYKYVGKAGELGSDGLPLTALDHKAAPQLARPPKRAIPVYLQPCDEKDERENRCNLLAMRDSCLRNGYILQTQLHKLAELD